MAFTAQQVKAVRRAQTERKLHELNTMTPLQLAALRQKRTADSQRLAFFYMMVEEQANGCWAWRGNRKPESQGAYPMMSHGKSKCTHAVAWAYKHIRGLEPPTRDSGKELSHQCEVAGLGSRCANPFHVEPQSRSENRLCVPEYKRKARMTRVRAHKKNRNSHA